jgi:hypothetical protein
MTDPVGAPTLAQMFSPTKSPFYAVSLIALSCLAWIFKSPLANYGLGLMLTIIAGSFCLAPFYKPRYSDQTYGLSLIFGRSVGLIGAMIAMAILISKSALTPDESSPRITPATSIFLLLWALIIIQFIYCAILFCFKTIEQKKDASRFNIIQFSLMHSVLLVFIVVLAEEVPIFSYYTFYDMIHDGGLTLAGAPAQVFVASPVHPESATLSLMLIWCLSGLVNAVITLTCIQPGWVSDHGEGSYN